MSRHQNAGRNYKLMIGNCEAFENVPDFLYLGTTAINQNCILEDIKCRLNSGNACYHSVQNLLSLSPKNFDIKIYKTTVLLVWV